MLRTAIVCLSVIPATAAMAQDDIRALLVSYAQSSGCSTGLDMLQMLVVDGMAKPVSDLEAVIDAMAAAGEAERSADGTSVTVLPPLCEVVGEGTSLAMAAGWVEGIITRAEGCRISLEDLRAQTVEQALPAEAFEPALDKLQAEGTVLVEGDEVAHTGC